MVVLIVFAFVCCSGLLFRCYFGDVVGWFALGCVLVSVCGLLFVYMLFFWFGYLCLQGL